MILSVEEPTKTVYISLAADLGQYSYALGSAQLLSSPPNPLYASFDNGLVGFGAQSTEVDLSGNIVYQLQIDVSSSYRAYRMRDLYTPTLP